jgi:hypothetical protein
VSIDVAVARLSAAVPDAMEQAVPCDYDRKSKFPPWFSNTVRYYIVKKKYFHRRFKKKRSDNFYNKFAFYRKRLVEPSAAADAFAKHFQSLYNNHCPVDIPLFCNLLNSYAFPLFPMRIFSKPLRG